MKSNRQGRNPAFFAAFVVLLFVCFPSFAKEKTAGDYFSDGVSEQENENWYLASQHFLEAIGENPSYGAAWFNLSKCSYMLGEYDLTLQQLGEAEKYLRDDAAVDNLRGMTYIALERFSDARAVFEKILKTFPNNVEARFGLAELDLFDGKITGAEKQYREALKREGKNRKALLSLAVVSAEMGKYDNARHFMDSALGFYSGEAEVHYLSAVIYAMKNDFSACEKQCRIAVELNGKYDRAYELLAKVLYARKSYDEVISICDFRLAKNRSAASAWYLKGCSQFRKGDVSDAIETWAAGLRIVPDDEIMRATLELAVKENISIEDSRRSEWAAYHMEVARLAKSRFDNSQMVWEYQRALKLDPSNEEARIAFADMLELYGMHELYLEQLLFIQKNRDFKDGSSDSENQNPQKNASQVSMDDTIEAYSDILGESLSKKWNVNPFFLDKTRWSLGIYYVPSPVHMNHVEGNKVASEFACDVFSGIVSTSVDARVSPVNGFGEAFKNARNSGLDYFVILNQDEGNRDLTLEYKFYSGRTGYLLSENSIYGAGNNRYSHIFRRFRNEILEKLPVTGKIVARNGKVLLSDLGRSENVREGAVFDIVKKGGLTTSGTTSGVIYKESDILGSFTVTLVGEEVSEGILEIKGFYDRVNTGDQLVLLSVPPSEQPGSGNAEAVQETAAQLRPAPNADSSGNSLNEKEESALSAEDFGIRRIPSFVDLIRSIY